MKSILLVLSLFCASTVFAQQDFDKRLLSKFSEERIQELSADHPSVIAYWTFFLDNSYEIVDAPQGKDFSNLPEINLKRKGNFNILDYQLENSGKSNTIYRISNSNQILVIKSGEKITEEFNAYRTSNTNGL